MIRIPEMKLRRALALLAFLASPAAVQSDPFTQQAAARLAQGSFREYIEFLSLQNDAVVSADIQKNVAWLECAFRDFSSSTA